MVFSARRVLRGKYFDLHYRASNQAEPSGEDIPHKTSARIGLVIAKKLARRAVQRNLLKRLAREVFRHRRDGLPKCDLVLRLAKPPGSQLDAQARAALRADLEQLFARLPVR